MIKFADTPETPTHLLSTSCYICGATEEHPNQTARGGHAFWSNADAAAHFNAEDKRLGNGRTWADGVFAEERPWPEVGA